MFRFKDESECPFFYMGTESFSVSGREGVVEVTFTSTSSMVDEIGILNCLGINPKAMII